MKFMVLRDGSLVYGRLLGGSCGLTPRVQVPNNHILTQNLYYKYYYPKPKHLIIGYLDPLGYMPHQPAGS